VRFVFGCGSVTLHYYFQESSLLAQIFQIENNPVFGFLCAPPRPSASSAVKGFGCGYVHAELSAVKAFGFSP
jgi:hypothetical protein